MADQKIKPNDSYGLLWLNGHRAMSAIAANSVTALHFAIMQNIISSIWFAL